MQRFVMLVTLVFLTAFFASLSAADEFRRVDVSDGPMLFFMHPLPSSGKGRVDYMYVFDPRSDRPARIIWQGSGMNFPRPIAMLKPGVLVMSHASRCLLLELATGQTKDVLPGNKVKILSVEKGKIYIENQVFNEEKSNSFTDFKIEASTQKYSILHIFDSTNPHEGAKVLSQQKIINVLREDSEKFLVITAGNKLEGRKLAEICKDGNVIELAEIPSEWISRWTRVEVSPNGRYMALTATREDRDSDDERDLLVVDVQEKRTVYSRSRIIDQIFDPFDGRGGLPLAAHGLFMTWIDNENLAYGCDRLVDVQIGLESRNERKIKIGGSDWRDEVKKVGSFALQFGRARFVGDRDPLVDIRNNTHNSSGQSIHIDRFGRWLAFYDGEKVGFVDGKTKKRQTLISGWSYSFRWVDDSSSFFNW